MLSKPVPGQRSVATVMDQSFRDGDWQKRLVEALPRLTASQRRIAKHVSDNPLDLAFSTTLQLSERIGTSEATIVRFANALGYSRYPMLQQSVRESIQRVLSPAQMLRDSDRVHHHHEQDALSRVMSADIENLRFSLDRIDRRDVHRAAALLRDGSSVYIMGTRALTPIALNLAHFLGQIRPRVHLVDIRYERVSDELMWTDQSSTVLVFDFARYNRRVLQATKLAQSHSSRIIVIADSIMAPTAAYADVLIQIQSVAVGFFRSFVAALCFVNALVLEVALHDHDRTLEQLAKLEVALKAFDILVDDSVYQDDEDTHFGPLRSMPGR